MKTVARHVTRFWSEDRSLTVFLILLVVEIFIIVPLGITGLAFRLINSMVFSLLLLVGLLAMSSHKVLQAVLTMFVALTVSTRWARIVFGVTGLEVLDGFLMLACVAGFMVIVLWQAFREGPISVHRIQGAVAGYLLLSVFFAIAYGLVAILSPDSFQMSASGVDADEMPNRVFYYFSVITLTTTGYGDITAIKPYARTLVMMETLIGQLYPAILIARLVSLHAETKRHGKQS